MFSNEVTEIISMQFFSTWQESLSSDEWTIKLPGTREDTESGVLGFDETENWGPVLLPQGRFAMNVQSPKPF